jgi:hypothetical protein
MSVAVLPNQFVPPVWKPNRKRLPWALCLSALERFAIQPAFPGASDNLDFFGFKNGLICGTQNAGLFGLLSICEVDCLSQNN